MRGPPPAPHLPYRSAHRAKRNARAGLFTLGSVKLIQRRLMQYPDLSEVSLRFFNVVPHGFEFIPDRNLAGTVQRGFEALDAKQGTGGKSISPLNFFADQHGSILKFAGTKRLSWASIF
jgi:hypothetical protein